MHRIRAGYCIVCRLSPISRSYKEKDDYPKRKQRLETGQAKRLSDETPKPPFTASAKDFKAPGSGA